MAQGKNAQPPRTNNKHTSKQPTETHSTYHMDSIGDFVRKQAVANKGRAYAFTWHKQFMDLMCLDTKEHMEAHLVPIRHHIRAGELEAKDYNNLTVRLRDFENGVGKVHCFVIQPTSDDALESLGLDLASLSFGMPVGGVAYWFYSKRNRDNMFAWLNKGLTAPPGTPPREPDPDQEFLEEVIRKRDELMTEQPEEPDPEIELSEPFEGSELQQRVEDAKRQVAELMDDYDSDIDI